jgi:RNA polymerase sigma factor (sigma-70 family)
MSPTALDLAPSHQAASSRRSASCRVPLRIAFHGVPMDELLNNRPAFLAFVRRRLRDPEEAEDVLQRAYLKAWGWRSPVAQPRAWFFRLLRHLIVDTVRRGQSHARLQEAWAVAQSVENDGGTENMTVANGPCACADEAGRRLSPALREALLLTVQDRGNASRIAQSRGVSSSALWVRAHRARKQWRAALHARCGACASEGRCRQCDCADRRNADETM